MAFGPVEFGYVFVVTYWTVLVAELVGDKSIYTVASLSVRFRTEPLWWGMLTAFAAKMLAAVALGQILVQAPIRLTASVSALTFFIAAFFIWQRQPSAFSENAAPALAGARATAVIPFASLFFIEWADLGQIAAATLSVHFHWALPVWLGGTLALLTKGTVAMALGRKLQGRIPATTLRIFGATSCAFLGLLALGKSLFPDLG
jgi:putative Ca2+/H+ antiporter (TMEM165/GDT1 family)